MPLFSPIFSGIDATITGTGIGCSFIVSIDIAASGDLPGSVEIWTAGLFVLGFGDVFAAG